MAYHDEEWGNPVIDDTVLFEFLTLDGAQCGLSWSTILFKRPAYTAAFKDWDIAAVARMACPPSPRPDPEGSLTTTGFDHTSLSSGCQAAHPDVPGGFRQKPNFPPNCCNTTHTKHTDVKGAQRSTLKLAMCIPCISFVAALLRPGLICTCWRAPLALLDGPTCDP